jgi:hypothetical protein
MKIFDAPVLEGRLKCRLRAGIPASTAGHRPWFATDRRRECGRIEVTVGKKA